MFGPSHIMHLAAMSVAFHSTPLIDAVKNNTPAAQELIRNATVEQLNQTSSGKTALDVAIEEGNLFLVKLLIEAGAKTTRTPLCPPDKNTAKEINHFIIQIRLKKKLLEGKRCECQWSDEHLTNDEDLKEGLRLILGQRVGELKQLFSAHPQLINTQDKPFKATLLTYAATVGDSAMVAVLLHRGAHLFLLTSTNKTALELVLDILQTDLTPQRRGHYERIKNMFIQRYLQPLRDACARHSIPNDIMIHHLLPKLIGSTATTQLFTKPHRPRASTIPSPGPHHAAPSLPAGPSRDNNMPPKNILRRKRSLSLMCTTGIIMAATCVWHWYGSSTDQQKTTASIQEGFLPDTREAAKAA
jgi:ankyrin repeat protein